MSFGNTGDSGWPQQFAYVGLGAAAGEQVCIDEAARLNAEPTGTIFGPENPVFYDYYTFTTVEGSFACNGRKRETFTQYEYFYNLASSTDELWYEAYTLPELRTGMYNGGDIENAQFVGVPERY